MFNWDSDDPFGFKEIREGHKKMEDEFRRLYAEPSTRVPVVGDRVIVAVGFLGRGHLWMRRECKVLEVGDTSVHVEIPDRYGSDKVDREWIHPALVTDVIPRANSVASEQ